MVKKTNEKAAKKPKRRSLAEIFAMAAQYELATKAEKDAKKTKGEAQKAVIEGVLEQRKLRKISSDKFGPHTNITIVQAEHEEYDADGLYQALTPKQRREAFDRNINLNELDAAARKKVLAVLTPDELDAVTTYSLNLDRLSIAVQDSKIPAKAVAPFAHTVKNAPYISITHGADK
jgi:hypothetical protein